MTKIFKSFAIGATAMGAALLTQTPVLAQVNGIATVSPEQVIAETQARLNGYQQIRTSYAAQIQAAQTVEQARDNLLKPYDTNNDNNLDQPEIEAALKTDPQLQQQIQTQNQQLQSAQAPIILAQLYVVEQVIDQYRVALQEVVAANNISLILAPDALIYYPDNVNINSKVVAAINAKQQAVNVTPPQGWRARQETANLIESIQRIDTIVALQAARAQQEQQQGQQEQQPQGR